MLVSPQTVLKETEDRLILLEHKAEILEQRLSTPSWAASLLVAAFVFMSSTLLLLILQIYI